MSIIKTELAQCILKKHNANEKVLQYFSPSTEAKVERFIGTLNQIINVL